MTQKIKVTSKKINVFYDQKRALHNISLEIPCNKVTSLIGPSGCGKSTFLRCINRMNDTIETCTVQGKMLVDGEDVYDKNLDPVLLRAKVGMVFQKPNPFPKSIFDNVAYGPKIHGLTNSDDELNDLVIRSLEKAGLYNEIKDRIFEPGTSLSGGQQQQLAIARALVTQPKLLVLDEPTEGIQPNVITQIGEVITRLVEEKGMTILLVEQYADFVRKYAHTFHVMNRGSFVAHGDTSELDETLVRKHLSV